jgi:hypothetical protein
MVAGVLSLLQPVWLGPVSAEVRHEGVQRVLVTALMVLGFTFGAFTFLAGRRMRQLESPEFVFLGSILAMVPLGVGWAVGLPMGIWALLVLRKPEVQAAFAAPKPGPTPFFPSPKPLLRWVAVSVRRSPFLTVMVQWSPKGGHHHGPRQTARSTQRGTLATIDPTLEEQRSHGTSFLRPPPPLTTQFLRLAA